MNRQFLAKNLDGFVQKLNFFIKMLIIILKSRSF